MTVTPDSARPLWSLKRRGLVRFSRDRLGVKLATLRGRINPEKSEKRKTARAMRQADTMYTALREHWIPPVESPHLTGNENG